MKNEKFVITITRQFGSLGRPIARQMSEILGIEYYDRDIVDKISEHMNIPVSTVSDLEERYAPKNFFNMVFPLGFQTQDMQDKLFEVQTKIINDFVDKESCIIVGRCSNYIMREHKNHLSIYIYAPYEARMKNCIETLKMSPAEAKKMIMEVDRARDKYHKHFTGYLPGDERCHHVMVDSSVFGPDETAVLLSNIVNTFIEKKVR